MFKLIESKESYKKKGKTEKETYKENTKKINKEEEGVTAAVALEIGVRVSWETHKWFLWVLGSQLVS